MGSLKGVTAITLAIALAPATCRAFPVYSASLIGQEDSDYVYGYAIDPVGDMQRCVAFQTFVQLGATIRYVADSGTAASCSRSINPHGELIDAEALQELGSRHQRQSAEVTVNDREQSTSFIEFPAKPESHAFLRSRGRMTDIDTRGRDSVAGYGMQNTAPAVGSATTSTGGLHGFLYTEARMYDLNNIVVSGLRGRTLTAALAINEQGQILAQSCLPAVDIAAPISCKTFRLDPAVPLADMPWLSQYMIVTILSSLFLGAAFQIRRCSEL